MTTVIFGWIVSAWGSLLNNKNCYITTFQEWKCGIVLQPVFASIPPHSKHWKRNPFLKHFFLQLLRCKADSWSMDLNELVTDLVSIETKTNTYGEDLGQQHCLVVNQQDSNSYMRMPSFQSSGWVSKAWHEGQWWNANKFCSATKTLFSSIYWRTNATPQPTEGGPLWVTRAIFSQFFKYHHSSPPSSDSKIL